MNYVDFATGRGLTPWGLCNEAWKWLTGSECKSNRLVKDSELMKKAPYAAPYYVTRYVEHLTKPKPVLPARAVP